MNKDSFVAAMKANGDTQVKLAKAMDCSLSRLNAKINHRKGADFYRYEMEFLIRRWKLTPEAASVIFFPKKVS